MLTGNKLLAELGFLSSSHSYFCEYQIWIASTHTVPSVSDSLDYEHNIKTSGCQKCWSSFDLWSCALKALALYLC